MRLAYLCSHRWNYLLGMGEVMNERIRQLAEQAGMVKILEEHASEYGAGTFENTPYPELEKFSELARADEREACARLCETLWDTPENGMATEYSAYGNECAEAIRARGQA
jgi:hypothetical protein